MKNRINIFVFSGLIILYTAAIKAENIIKDVNNSTNTINTIKNENQNDQSPIDEALNIADRLDDTVVQWATDKITNCFNYNWVDYKDVTDKAKQYFTSQGYGHYLKSLKDSGSTESVLKNKLILQVKPNGPGKILKQGIYQGKYAWQISLPLNFTYYGISETIPRKATVVVLVSMASKVEYTDGLAIEQLILKPET